MILYPGRDVKKGKKYELHFSLLGCVNGFVFIACTERLARKTANILLEVV